MAKLKLVERPLVTRISGKGDNRVETKTLTVPKRFITEWKKDRTMHSNDAVLIPLGERGKLGFLTLPRESPILLARERLEYEVKYFEKTLERIHHENMLLVRGGLEHPEAVDDLTPFDEYDKKVKVMERTDWVEPYELDFMDVKGKRSKKRVKPDKEDVV